MLENIESDPFVPLIWGSNQAGMQAGKEIHDTIGAEREWLNGLQYALHQARALNALGLHKQIVNRIVEPWMWITVIATGAGSAWENFFNLRCHRDAEPHIQHIAFMARDAYDKHTPTTLAPGEWHLPLFDPEHDADVQSTELPKLCTARCARVSYLTHDGKRDVLADKQLHDRLAASGHWSPFEHCAMVSVDPSQYELSGNLGAGWVQYRKLFQGEYCTKAPR